MFRLSGFGDEISPELDEQLDILESERIRYIELRRVLGKNVLELSDEKALKVKKRLDERGFSTSAIGSPIGKVKITERFDSHLKRFKRALELARLFETKYIRVFSYYLPEGGRREDFRDEVMRRMKEKTKLAEENGTVLLHENEGDVWGDTGEHCLDILTTINSPNLRALFDPANFIMVGEKPFSSAFPKLDKFIEYLHIKDAKFSDRSITLAGEGDAEIKEILLALKERKFDGFLSLEPHLSVAGKRSGFSGSENFRRAAKALKNLLKEIGG